jgi:peptidyl-prolyl cis-trans isomerase C
MPALPEPDAASNVLTMPPDGLDYLRSVNRCAIPWQPTALHRSAAIWFRRALREPLLHFLLAGAALLALSSLFGNSGGSAQNTIEVSAAEIDRLREIWMRQWGHAPDAKQLDNLVGDYVREEIYYREARASGLDKDDTIVRRRLVEKMEFLSQEIASGEPSDTELQQFFDANRQRYALPVEVGFTHIYFSPSRRGERALDDARAALARLASVRAGADSSTFAASLGDSFMLQSEYPPQTRDQIKNLFGDEFAARVVKLKPGGWAGPIRSSYGWHLVRVTGYIPPRQPELDEVRNQVAIDYKNQRLQNSSDAYYARLRQRYKVEIDQKALAAAKARAPQSDGAQPANNTQDAGTPAELD